MKFDFLVGKNLYGSAAHFSRVFAQALEKKGVKTRLFPIDEGGFDALYEHMSHDPPDLSCSFSDVHLGGAPIGSVWQIPHVSILVDPAIYFLHQMRGEYSWISCVDEGDVEFVRRLGFEQVFYLPHAVEQTLLTPPGGERPYEVVFFGTCIEPEIEDKQVLMASERVLAEKDLSILQSLVDLGISDEALPRMHALVDRQTRFQDRVEKLRGLDGVHIWGEGPWKKHVPKAVVHPPIAFEKTFSILKQARFTIESSPRFKRGLHERVLYATLLGTAIFDGEAYDPQKVLAKQEEVLAAHTWDHRAETVVAVLRRLQ